MNALPSTSATCNGAIPMAAWTMHNRKIFHASCTRTWSPTRFVEFRKDQRLLAVAVTDFCNAGLSAVYTFYDPDELARGLGTFAILRQIAIAREQGLSHLYLGFWIAGHSRWTTRSASSRSRSCATASGSGIARAWSADTRP